MSCTNLFNQLTFGENYFLTQNKKTRFIKMENNYPEVEEKNKTLITDSNLIFTKNWKEVEFKHYVNGKISVEIDEFERQGIMLEKEDLQELFNWLKEFCD